MTCLKKTIACVQSLLSEGHSFKRQNFHTAADSWETQCCRFAGNTSAELTASVKLYLAPDVTLHMDRSITWQDLEPLFRPIMLCSTVSISVMCQRRGRRQPGVAPVTECFTTNSPGGFRCSREDGPGLTTPRPLTECQIRWQGEQGTAWMMSKAISRPRDWMTKTAPKFGSSSKN
jgi:hypothetical protein